MRIADSCAQPGGAVDCPGLGWQGSKPVAAICVAPPHTKPSHKGASCQLSFCAITACPEKSRRKGFAKVPGTKNGAPLIDGPRALSNTVAGALPSMINPPIIVLSPLWTNPRAEMLLSSEIVLASASNTSTNPIPVPPPTPVTIAVYAPGGSVIRIADSRAQFGGDTTWPGLGVQGLNPRLTISVAPSQTKSKQVGESCQLSFCAMTV